MKYVAPAVSPAVNAAQSAPSARTMTTLVPLVSVTVAAKALSRPVSDAPMSEPVTATLPSPPPLLSEDEQAAAAASMKRAISLAWVFMRGGTSKHDAAIRGARERAVSDARARGRGDLITMSDFLRCAADTLRTKCSAS